MPRFHLDWIVQNNGSIYLAMPLYDYERCKNRAVT